MELAGGYVLVLSSDRQAVFLQCVGEGEQFAEPVSDFSHSRNFPLVCFVLANSGLLTHIAKAKRGVRAGTGYRRLNLMDAEELPTPISIDAVVECVRNSVRKRVQACFTAGGLLSPKGFDDVVEAIMQLSPSSRDILTQYSRERRERIQNLSLETRQSLAIQKEALATALALAGLSRVPLQQWTPVAGTPPASFLDGLSQVRLREDPMVIHDLQNIPGFTLLRTLPYNAAIFQNESVRLTVILANRQPLEQQFGTDLIYFNESFSSFVMVQYKAMEQENGQALFRLPNQQLTEEIGRMDKTLEQLRACAPNASTKGYRLNEDPFFLKLCPRLVLLPDTPGPIRGMYIPLEYWRLLMNDPRLIGPQGGLRVSYENVGRYFDNTTFISVVEKSWVGTTVQQSAVLESVIRSTIEAGKAIVFAVRKDRKLPLLGDIP